MWPLVYNSSRVTDIYSNYRHERLKRFVRAITRPTRKDLIPLRVKDIYRLEEIETVFQRLVGMILSSVHSIIISK